MKDAEVAWIDSKIRARSKKILPSLGAKESNLGTNGSNANASAMEIDNEEDDEEDISTNGEISLLPSCKLVIDLFRIIPSDVIELFFPADNTKLLALEPIPDEAVPPHKSTFVNELKISDFKQVLLRNNIPSEFSNGALWCANSTIAIRRVSFLCIN